MLTGQSKYLKSDTEYRGPPVRDVTGLRLKEVCDGVGDNRNPKDLFV